MLCPLESVEHLYIIKFQLLNEFHTMFKETHFRTHLLEKDMSERLFQSEDDVIFIYFNLSVSHS